MHTFGRPVNSCIKFDSANKTLWELSEQDSTHITHKVALFI